MDHFELRLVGSRDLAPGVRHYVFERSDGERLVWAPGQFIQVHFEVDGVTLRRSYSLATMAPEGGDSRIEFAVSLVPGGSAAHLFESLQPGDRLQATGPNGRFVLFDDPPGTRYLLIGTGTGVTPYRAMLPQIRQRITEHNQRFVLLLGARSPEELLYGDEFEAFARDTTGFRFHPCFSRAGREPPRDHDRRGYVQDALAELAPDPVTDVAYLCGNPNMVDAAFAALKALDFPIANIRREKYISPPTLPRPRTPVA